MIDTITRDELRELAEHSQKGCVSLYLPTHRTGREMKQDPIRLKNLLREAKDRLTETGLNEQETRAILNSSSQLLEDELFWQHQGDGLALFCSPDFTRHYRLPLQVQELAVVSHRFHLKPMLPMIADDGKYFLLALSKNDARFFQGSRFSIQELEPSRMPKSLAEALRFDVPEKSLQHHSGTGTVTQTPMYHGQGSGKDEENTRVLRYFQQIDKGLNEFLREETTPLVLAGVEEHFPIFREASDYKHILEEGVPGNPDQLRPEELHEKTWEVVKPRFAKEQEENRERFGQALAENQASTTLDEVVLAAGQGRVDTLFVALEHQKWGKVDLANSKVIMTDSEEATSQELLDYAAVQTFLNGGQVFAVSTNLVPKAELVAAIYRY